MSIEFIGRVQAKPASSEESLAAIAGLHRFEIPLKLVCLALSVITRESMVAKPSLIKNRSAKNRSAKIRPAKTMPTALPSKSIREMGSTPPNALY